MPDQVLQLLKSHGPNLYALLTRLTLRQDTAEDLMQDLFVKLSASNGFRRAVNPAAYARRVAMHLAFDWRRSQWRSPGLVRLAREPEDDEPSPLNRLIDKEQMDQLLDAVDTLNTLRREVFVMRYIQQETYEVIAKQLGTTPHKVRGLCHKAIAQLRNVLSRHGADRENEEHPDVQN